MGVIIACPAFCKDHFSALSTGATVSQFLAFEQDQYTCDNAKHG